VRLGIWLSLGLAGVPGAGPAAGDLDAAEALLQHGAEVNARDPQGTTPLMSAAANDGIAMARFLLGKGADVRAQDQRGYTALMVVVGSGNVAMAGRLLDSGSDRNAKNALGLRAADIAELLGDGQIGALVRH
jgi:ankyrin repeat protein